MIFAARGLLVSLAFFAMVYCPLSLLVVLFWRGTKWIRRATAAKNANLWFGLRISPFAVSALVTVFFTFPSFWLLERPSLDEDTETFLLALCSLIILGAGLFRVLRTQARTTRAVRQWSVQKRSAQRASIVRDAVTPVLSASHGAPALIVVGIRKPRVMVSDMAATVLNDDEMQVALRHEVSHARSWDNLKKLLVSATPFPGMGGLEGTWHEAAELAADDRAVRNRQEALDLAAALIKLARSFRQLPKPVLATELVSGPSSIKLRVDRLLKWRTAVQPSRHAWPWALPVLLTVIAGIVSNYGAALVLTHRLTELLVP